jgi:hypothetical protein
VLPEVELPEVPELPVRRSRREPVLLPELELPWCLPEVELPEVFMLPEVEPLVVEPEVEPVPGEPVVVPPVPPIGVLLVEPGVVWACAVVANRPIPKRKVAVHSDKEICFFIRNEKMGW